MEDLRKCNCGGEAEVTTESEAPPWLTSCPALSIKVALDSILFIAKLKSMQDIKPSDINIFFYGFIIPLN